MSFSRRAFFSLGGEARSWAPAAIAARGREAVLAEVREPRISEPALIPPPEAGEIRISSNENPLGPGRVAIESIRAAFDQSGRYPFNSRPSSEDLKEVLAKAFRAEPENIVLGAGSTEILRNAVRAFTSPRRGLVTADPSFENPVRVAEAIGSPVAAVPVERDFRLDLELMARAARGAGLVFLCNPNNPTATVHSRRAVEEFVRRVKEESPGTAILIDEAYHEYVDSPSYATAAPLAMTLPGVFVSRTFSKAFGMAGLRVGYALGQGQTILELARYKINFDVNVLGVAAAAAAFNDAAHIAREKSRNAEARRFTLDFFEAAGYKATDSQANFIFVNLGRPARQFREACEKYNVRVGRDFPPFEKTHARISIGTMDEMRRAVEVFREVLGTAVTEDREEGAAAQ